MHDYPITPTELTRRVHQHTWLTIGGGLVLFPLLILFSGSVGLPIPSVTYYLGLTAELLAISIVPAAIFAWFRQPAMRKLFQRVSLLPRPWQRAMHILLGTLLIFLAFVALATGAVILFCWAQYGFRYQFFLDAMPLGLTRIMLAFSLPWLLAALASAWYVNRDVLSAA